MTMLLSGQAALAVQEETIQDRFARARILAAAMVRDVDVEALSFNHIREAPFQKRVTDWYEQHREELIADIRTSKHLWQKTDRDHGQLSCGKTDHFKSADILFSERLCTSSEYSLQEAAKLLIGESAHHLGQVLDGKTIVVGDEFADWVRLAVFNAWSKRRQNNSGDQDGRERMISKLTSEIYQSSSFRGLLTLTHGLEMNLGNDPYAYRGVEVSYNIRTIPGAPGGAIEQVQPIDEQRANPDGIEEQKLVWQPRLNAYATKAVMAFTGDMLYDIGGGFTYRGPYYCKVGIEVRIRPLQESRILNVTIIRPQAIEPHDCRYSGSVEEYVGFQRLGG